ncbi:DUF3467 domain-containing protein [Salisaeta longa]|uniref:DUF3467 domain-containing protein n=1 Tax=Salisaeta longa TaxID=503170 RepID=UPI0003B459BB|nr:DUF3467 domain-containing protein [Salisaeta longa]
MEDFEHPNAPQGQEMNVEIDEETAEGTYANLVMVSHSPEEFILDFIRMIPGTQTSRVKSRIVVTPQHAKRILGALKENVDRYEAAHGTIREPGDDDSPPPMHFGGFEGKA